jgi:GT2 family glycosyltransferase
VAVVVPVHNRRELTKRFLQSFAAVTYPNATVVIVDDGSSDGTSELVAREHPDVILLQGDGSLWWAGATNMGVVYASERRFDYVLTINDDCTVKPDFLSRLVETAEANENSIVGSCINEHERPGVVWAAGGAAQFWNGRIIRLAMHGCQWEETSHGCAVLPTELLTGCGALIPLTCYRHIGLYNARSCPQYHADSDFILRARRSGYRVLVNLGAVVLNDSRHTARAPGILRALTHKGSPHYLPAVIALSRYAPSVAGRVVAVSLYYLRFWADRLHHALCRTARQGGTGA